METRILLHGGRIKLKDAGNDRFFRELTKPLKDGDEILSIGFANRDEVQRLEYFERDKGFILAQTQQAIKVVNATYENFEAQLKSAKSIYITGGNSPELVKDIQRYPQFLELIRGKIIGGTSAGACLFSAFYLYSPETNVEAGLGVFPIRLMVHFGNPEFNSTDETLLVLQAAHKEMELVKLKECEWIERRVNL